MNYNDLTRPNSPQMVLFMWGISLQPPYYLRLVIYYSSPRYIRLGFVGGSGFPFTVNQGLKSKSTPHQSNSTIQGREPVVGEVSACAFNRVVLVDMVTLGWETSPPSNPSLQLSSTCQQLWPLLFWKCVCFTPKKGGRPWFH